MTNILMELPLEFYINGVLSVIAAIIGLLAHNFMKQLTDREVSFVFTLPSLEGNKLKLGGALSSVIMAGMVGFLLMNPITAFFAGYAGSNVLKDLLVTFEKRGMIDKPIIP